MCQLKNFENQLIFGEDMKNDKVGLFWDTVSIQQILLAWLCLQCDHTVVMKKMANNTFMMPQMDSRTSAYICKLPWDNERLPKLWGAYLFQPSASPQTHCNDKNEKSVSPMHIMVKNTAQINHKNCNELSK